MIQLKIFVFNTFQVNTYILYDETGKAVIIDPACYGAREESELTDFITVTGLKPTLCVNTHAHIDHILGNNFIYQKFGIKPLIHEAGSAFVRNAPYFGSIYGFEVQNIIISDNFLQPDSLLKVGNFSLKVLYTPGHADGSVSMYSGEQGFAIVGDVIFFESIGRTDLPTGNYQVLIRSIQDQLLTLEDNTVLYPGHGHETTVEHEKKFNPFINGNYFEE